MRVLERLDELYAIGGGPGANRPHGSPAEDEAHQRAASWLTDAGLEVDVDRHGNLLGHASARPDVWVGSHLDTVPQGGRFDGALGVVAAIEAVERVGAGSVVVFRG
ncbi:MAG: Zn-dependent hydrolase, partial [Gaiellaceae bacterium]